MRQYDVRARRPLEGAWLLGELELGFTVGCGLVGRNVGVDGSGVGRKEGRDVWAGLTIQGIIVIKKPQLCAEESEVNLNDIPLVDATYMLCQDEPV